MDVEARARQLEREDDGWAGTILVEPLTALAGGILGGVMVAVTAIVVGDRAMRRRAVLLAARRVRGAR